MRFLVVRNFEDVGVWRRPGDYVQADGNRAAYLRRMGLIGGPALPDVERAILPRPEQAVAPQPEAAVAPPAPETAESLEAERKPRGRPRRKAEAEE